MLSEIQGQTYLADSSHPRGSNLLRVARKFLGPIDEWTRGPRPSVVQRICAGRRVDVGNSDPLQVFSVSISY